ncbi:MAG: carboxypeptidase-like regulatory domain-containing protein [Actinomycetia bacterium]|nr:carboxypeptidase-like regulatory domain-containing protein [Actinomycetes bacterium]
MKIQGRVVDRSTGSPLVNAHVYQDGPGGRIGDVSDLEGRFSFDGDGSTVTVSHVGHASMTYAPSGSYVVVSLAPAAVNLDPVTIRPDGPVSSGGLAIAGLLLALLVLADN